MNKIFIACSLFFILSIHLLPKVEASTEPACARRDEIINKFEIEFGEVPQAMGLVPFGLMIEVLAASTGTFTILVTRSDGISCILAAGEDWSWVREQDPSSSI